MNTTQLLNQVLISGGATVKPNLASYTGKGYAVAVSKSFERVIKLDGDARELQSSFNEALTKLRFDAASRGGYVGLWVDNGAIYLDLTEVVQSRSKAIDLGLRRGQLAIFDFASMSSIDLTKIAA